MIALRDLLLVASFETSRALRTWRALALVAVYCVGTGGSTWLFIEGISLAEAEIAEVMGIAAPDTPGTLLAEVAASPEWRRTLSAMTGSETRAEALLGTPVLAVFHRWMGFLLIPLFAATASAECLAIDVASRAIRYEALRTGRTPIVFGRWAGQLGLAALAATVGAALTWALGLGAMVGNSPIPLAVALADSTLRSLLFAMPASAAGVLASSLVRSAAWARVLALAAVVGSWVGYGVCQLALREGAPWQARTAAGVASLFPQAWLGGLWDTTGWISPVVLVLLATAIASIAAARFAWRDL